MTAIGVDIFNLTTTGQVGRTVTCSGGGLNEHIPLVIVDEPTAVDIGEQSESRDNN